MNFNVRVDYAMLTRGQRAIAIANTSERESEMKR
jgi:hypothetical protein